MEKSSQKILNELLVKAENLNLYVSVVSDALDIIGIRDKVMSSKIKPLYPEAFIVGRAFTILATDVSEVPKEPFKKEIEYIDSLKSGDVVVGSINEKGESASWGELVSTAAQAKGVKGVVVDGCVRDSKHIIEMKFPVFSAGITPADSKGRSGTIAYNIPIKCGGVTVYPGDIIFGDRDGVVVVPQDVAEEVINYATEKCGVEDKTRDELRKGVSVHDVFKKYGVL